MIIKKAKLQNIIREELVKTLLEKNEKDVQAFLEGRIDEADAKTPNDVTIGGGGGIGQTIATLLLPPEEEGMSITGKKSSGSDDGGYPTVEVWCAGVKCWRTAD